VTNGNNSIRSDKGPGSQDVSVSVVSVRSDRAAEEAAKKEAAKSSGGPRK
jgi:hypothetical protein